MEDGFLESRPKLEIFSIAGQLLNQGKHLLSILAVTFTVLVNEEWKKAANDDCFFGRIFHT